MLQSQYRTNIRHLLLGAAAVLDHAVVLGDFQSDLHLSVLEVEAGLNFTINANITQACTTVLVGGLGCGKIANLELVIPSLHMRLSDPLQTSQLQ